MSKYSEIAEVLRKEIEQGKYEKAGKLPTEFELVDRFGVSRQTIRQAISTLKAMNIVHQVQGSGTYINDPRARGRAPESVFKNIFVICTYISEYIFPSIIRGIDSTLNGTGYRFNLAATGNKVDLERKILTDIIRLRECDGIIVEGSKTGFPNPNIALYKQIMDLGIPMVFLHCSYQELPEAVVVGMDDRAGGKIAVKKLIDAGCRKIMGFFKSDDRQGLLRYAGFSDGVIESGLGLENTELRWYTTEDMVDQRLNLDSALLDHITDAGIDGIVCYNDLVAGAILQGMMNAGKKAPRIISFDRSIISNNGILTFESLGHQKENLGILAAEKIRNMVEGKKETSVFLPWID